MEEETREDSDLIPQKQPCGTVCCALIESCVKASFGRIWAYIKTYRNLIFALTGGQILSIFLCGTGVTSQALEKFYNIAVPTTQLFLTYFILAVIFGPVLAVRKNFLDIIKENWWKYIFLGVVDVEANFLVVLAYKYTTLTSIQLLDSFTIVMVLLLSFIFLRVRYLIVHLMGVAMCIIGIISLFLADLTGSRNNPGSDPLLGDLLCIFAACLYAISNVSQEYLVKNHSISEWLGFIGIVGSVVSGIQLSIVDRRHLAAIIWGGGSLASIAVFAVSQTLFYMTMPLVMKISSAAVVNLSLLTADIFTLVFGVFLFKFKFSLLYILSFIIIMVGVFIFNLKTPPVATPKQRLEKLRNRLRRHKIDKDLTVLSQQPNNIDDDSTVMSSLPRNWNTDNERQGILVRGPLEAALSSHSYTTEYSESMSYSYGSNSKEGAEILKRLGSEDEMKRDQRAGGGATEIDNSRLKMNGTHHH